MRTVIGFVSALLSTVSCRSGTGERESATGISVRWAVKLPAHDETRTVSVIPAVDGDRVYFALPGGTTAAFTTANGALLWTAPVAGDLAARNVVAGGGRVFRAGDVVQALDAVTGAERWRVTPAAYAGFGTAATDGSALYFGTQSHRVYALDGATGQTRWMTDVGAGWAYDGTVEGVSVAGDTVYAAVQPFTAPTGYISIGWVFALDRTSGRLLWSYQSGDGTTHRDVSDAPTVAGRLLLLNDKWSNAFTAVDRFTGRELWRTEGVRNGGLGSRVSPAAVGETVYVASVDTYAYALSALDGHVVWKTTTGASNFDFSACGNRLLVVPSGVRVLDRSSGASLGSLSTGSDAPSGPAAVQGARAYVAGRQSLFALECPS